MLKLSVSPSGERNFTFASLWLRRFLWGDCWREIIAPSYRCVWSQIPWRSRRIIVLLQSFLHEHLLEFGDCQNLWHRGSISPKAILVLRKYFLYFRFYAVASQSIVDLGYTSVVLAIPRSPFLGKVGMQPFVHLSIVSDYIRRCSIEAVCLRIPLSSILLGYFIKPCRFSV